MSPRLTQWVSAIVNSESKSDVSLNTLQSVLGPLKTNPGDYELLQDRPTSDQTLIDGYFIHEVAFKIDEPVCIQGLKIYQKICVGSSLMKIEALNNEENKWEAIWAIDRPLQSISRPTLFVPDFEPTSFMADTIRVSISGSLNLIDAIGWAGG